MNSRLQHRVVVQTKTRTEFEGGAYTTSWATASTEWASVQYDAKSSETYTEDKKQQMSYYKVVMRQDVNVTNENRLLYNGKILVIEEQGDPTGNDRMKRLTCRVEEV